MMRNKTGGKRQSGATLIFLNGLIVTRCSADWCPSIQPFEECRIAFSKGCQRCIFLIFVQGMFPQSRMDLLNPFVPHIAKVAYCLHNTLLAPARRAPLNERPIWAASPRPTLAPCPSDGVMPCAASPMTTTGPSDHVSRQSTLQTAFT